MEQTTNSADERLLSPQLTMSAVTLRVGDLDGMSDYYAGSLDLEPLVERADRKETRRVLGRAGEPILRLIHAPDLRPGSPRDAGLFHTAFLFEDRASLAGALLRTARDPRSRYAGAADHLVSEAFYFTDPEGNGVELYWDRGRDEWQYDRGEVRMDTIALDPNRYLGEHLGAAGAPGGIGGRVSVGHVHLQVGDVRRARGFYVDALGFEATLGSLPGALFASAGGYHHHVAMNSWNSRGAGPRAARLGLGDVAIAVPGRSDLDALVARLISRGIAYADTGDSIVSHDPWGTQVTVGLTGADAERIAER